jgi:hypothetical protein
MPGSHAHVWLDYDPAHPELFGDASGGYAAPIFFEGDIARLAARSEDILITLTKDAYKIVARLPEPGFRRPLDQLRFQKNDLERLSGKLKHEAQALQERHQQQPAAKAAAASESQSGIGKAEVIAAFAGIVRLDWTRHWTRPSASSATMAHGSKRAPRNRNATRCGIPSRWRWDRTTSTAFHSVL